MGTRVSERWHNLVAAGKQIITPASVMWALPTIILGIALFICWGKGMFAPDAGWLTKLCAAGGLLVSMVAILLRKAFWRWAQHWPLPVRIGWNTVALAAVTVLSWLALELPFNPHYAQVPPRLISAALLITALAVCGLYFLCVRHAFAVMIVPLAWGILGTAQYFVNLFKGASLMPADFLVLSTAADVAGGYQYQVTQPMLVAAVVVAGAWWLLAWVISPRGTADAASESVKPRKRIWRLVANSVGGLALLGTFVGLCSSSAFVTWLNPEVGYWTPVESYQANGFIPSFLQTLQDTKLVAPPEYDAQEAQDIEKQYARQYQAAQGEERLAAEKQFRALKPSVIAVMNESFADLSIFKGLGVGYSGPQFIKQGTDDALYRGTVSTPVLGGGTCNSEFEFLTDTSMAYIGPNKYPFVQYKFDDVENIVQQFNDLGYITTGMHPNLPSNWRRDGVYRELGFSRAMFIDQFADAPTLHAGVTDKATYESILNLLREDKAPQFIFDVTMQNHGGYDQLLLDEADTPQLNPAGFAADTNAALNQYLGLIRHSDEDLRWFVQQLKQLDRPVVLVFFGDHQPALSTEYNDDFFPVEDQATHTQREYNTPFVIWANYEVAGSQPTVQELDVSPDLLPGLTLAAIGAPLSEYQQAKMQLRAEFPQQGLYAVRDKASGKWYEQWSAHNSVTQAPFAKAYQQLELLEYHHFGAKQRFSLFR